MMHVYPRGATVAHRATAAQVEKSQQSEGPGAITFACGERFNGGSTFYAVPDPKMLPENVTPCEKCEEADDATE